MDLRTIKKLIDMVQDSGIGELEVNEGDFKVRIAKSSSHTQTSFLHSGASQVVVPNAMPLQSQSSNQLPQHHNNAVSEDPNIFIVKSPMVGTFYSAASPQAAPFVTVGQTVKKGDPLCIIEAMKLMNEVECEQGGVIAAILVESGQAVEYGQAIFKLTLS